MTFGKTLLALALALAWSLGAGVHPAGAQSGARLQGVVLDESGGVLPGVAVTMTHLAPETVLAGHQGGGCCRAFPRRLRLRRSLPSRSYRSPTPWGRFSLATSARDNTRSCSRCQGSRRSGRRSVLDWYVNLRGRQFADRSPRNNIPYFFRIIDSPEINAFAIPAATST